MDASSHMLLRACAAVAVAAAMCWGCARSTQDVASAPGPSSASPAPLAPPRDPDQKLDPRLVGAMNELGFRLCAQLGKQGPPRNLFISSASIEMALAMAMDGAKGATRDQMAAALGLDRLTPDEMNAANAQLLALLRSPDSGIQVSAANSLWGQQGLRFLPAFLDAARKAFDAEVRALDFASPGAVDVINGWVAEQTRNRITNLIQPGSLDPGVGIVLVNALYFKGTWTTPFEPHETYDERFTPGSGRPIRLPMMHRSGLFSYLETDRFQAVALPYGEEHVQAYVVLPKPGVAWSDFTASLTRSNWDRWMARFTRQRGNLAMPKVKCEYGAMLKPALSALGMLDAFKGSADFSGMASVKPLFIGDVVHKTALDVNEKGTEAAAATAVVMLAGAAPVQPARMFQMTVDHPFFLAIRDVPTGAILFMGTIQNPQG